jgi:hypothetical protein
MTTTLIDLHTVDLGGTPEGCTCPRAACGATVSGPKITPVCTAHAHLRTESHPAYDCPALPADTDLSRLWIVLVKWTADGPVPLRAFAFDRVMLADLRGTDALWDVTEADGPEDAITVWQARVDAMRAEAAAAQAAQVAAAQERARLREAGIAALRRSSHRKALQMATALRDDE